ncbi:hypothetical protein LIER_41233 [Lithospermum erythrorhizon]|uniref:Uncharacterized protein n=1 Tax=Lithospermum erythrorhizon TaxID=34254 RepID=A0AAV3RBX9_LITER
MYGDVPRLLRIPPRKSKRCVKLVVEGSNEVVVPRRARTVRGNVGVEQASVHPVENVNPEPPIANPIPLGIPVVAPVQPNPPQVAVGAPPPIVRSVELQGSKDLKEIIEGDESRIDASDVGRRGRRFGGRENQGCRVASSQSSVGAGRGWIFTITQEETQNSPKVVTGT